MSYVVKFAKNEEVVLKVLYDDTAENPREWDNLGTMICFHRRYQLGDKHSYSDPRDFFEDLAGQFIDSSIAKKLLEDKLDKEFEEYKVVQNEEGGYVIESDSYYNPFSAYVYETEEEAIRDLENEKQYWIENHGIQALSSEELMKIINDHVVILPLYLYDHSGLRMNTTGFSCPWDSGQVGWIYVTYKDIIKEYGSLDIETAKKVLMAEVEVYNQYLSGDVYGFVLETLGGTPIDSCWGFYGLETLEKELKNHLPEEYVGLVDQLDYVYV